MKFSIRFAPSVDDDLDWYSAREQKMILDSIEKFLGADADVETRRRKQLRPNPVAPWELTIGRYRAFYGIEEAGLVRVLAVGHKVHNELSIRGRRVEI